MTGDKSRTLPGCGSFFISFIIYLKHIDFNLQNDYLCSLNV